MSNTSAQVKELKEQIANALQLLEVDKKTKELESVSTQLANPEVWSDNIRAQKLSKQKAKIESIILPWQNLSSEIGELSSFVDLDDDSLKHEISHKLTTLEAEFNKLREQLKLNGKYDQYDAIMTIQAGAGGTDAMDWAQMLQRMYTRWAESHKVKVELIDQSLGDEAGIKSATLNISGGYAYGKLKGEHGVHRLVRQSPFNSAASRETSFALVEVVPAIEEPDEVNIDEKSLRIDTFRASGHGGQSVNKTDSAVRITHIPTNIVISMQNEKSQIQNREVAMKILRSKLAQLATEQHQEEVSKLKGPNQDAAWGNQIRNYVMHPYKLVKDTRTGAEASDAEVVLGGDIDLFIEAYLEGKIGDNG